MNMRKQLEAIKEDQSIEQLPQVSQDAPALKLDDQDFLEEQKRLE